MSTGNGRDDADAGDDDLDVEVSEPAHEDDHESSEEHAASDAPPVRAAADETELELFREPDPSDEGDEADLPDATLEALKAKALDEALESLRPDPIEPASTLGSLAPESVPPPTLSELPPAPLRVGARCRVIAVGGARGGVGKTVLAANLGLYLSTLGRKVVLVDADPGGANLHTCLGTAPATPLGKLRRAARNESPSKPMGLPEALRETPYRGLSLLHLGLDEPAAGSGRADRVARLLAPVRELEADYIGGDLGVGLGRELVANT